MSSRQITQKLPSILFDQIKLFLCKKFRLKVASKNFWGLKEYIVTRDGTLMHYLQLINYKKMISVPGSATSWYTDAHVTA